jgi:hypothetical protein
MFPQATFRKTRANQAIRYLMRLVAGAGKIIRRGNP